MSSRPAANIQQWWHFQVTHTVAPRCLLQNMCAGSTRILHCSHYSVFNSMHRILDSKAETLFGGSIHNHRLLTKSAKYPSHLRHGSKYYRFHYNSHSCPNWLIFPTKPSQHLLAERSVHLHRSRLVSRGSCLLTAREQVQVVQAAIPPYLSPEQTRRSCTSGILDKSSSVDKRAVRYMRRNKQ